MRVLVVDDSEDLRRLFARMPRRKGCDVREAEDGQAALDWLGQFIPDVVLTDLMMPVLDGVELIRRLRVLPGMAAVPVLAVPADATPEAEERARAAGASDFLAKPVDMATLIGRLRGLNR